VEGEDADGDGYSLLDCDDTSATVHPEAQELANQSDDNCDGLVDETLPETELEPASLEVCPPAMEPMEEPMEMPPPPPPPPVMMLPEPEVPTTPSKLDEDSGCTCVAAAQHASEICAVSGGPSSPPRATGAGASATLCLALGVLLFTRRRKKTPSDDVEPAGKEPSPHEKTDLSLDPRVLAHERDRLGGSDSAVPQRRLKKLRVVGKVQRQQLHREV
jgi:hypothetical protein